MSYAENTLPAVLSQASQTSDFLKELGLTPQQNANLIEFLRTGDTGKTANSVLIFRYLQAFNEGRTGEPLAEAAGQSGAQAQDAALGAAGARQDVDVNAALSGQRTGELTGGAGENFKAGSFDDLPSTAQNSYKGYEGNGWKGNYSGQTPGTNAGRAWGNELGDLPALDQSGNQITYREFDVNNRISGTSRDSERFLVGSDGAIYYTPDHYGTFIRIQ